MPVGPGPTEEDPVIPFRVSHATLLAGLNAKVNMLVWLMGGMLTLAVAGLSWMVMNR